MRALYVSEQGCYLSLNDQLVRVKRQETLYAEVQLPLLQMILIFGKSQVTTQVIRACLWRNIPIVYLSRMGYCYGRILPIERGYRQLARYQDDLTLSDRLQVAREIVCTKLRNSRTVLMRQHRRQPSSSLDLVIQSLAVLVEKVRQADNIPRIMGLEGAGAAQYFSAFGDCFTSDEFIFGDRSRRPPGNPVNALLSFGYQVLWNHLLALIEVHGLDPYVACLHEGHRTHAALASDLLEEFRAPFIDAFVMYLINRKMMDVRDDFVYHNGGCYLNDVGRVKYLKAFVKRMEETITDEFGESQPKWDLLNQQVKAFKQFVYDPVKQPYVAYQIR
jgi:CRISPR-associated protein Cas1